MPVLSRIPSKASGYRFSLLFKMVGIFLGFEELVTINS